MDKEILNSFTSSVERLNEIVKAPKTVANRDSAIKRFELTAELGWKVIKEYLRDKEIICRSPRECLLEAFKAGLISDNPLWLRVLEDRNLSVHTYNEKLAEDIYGRLKDYLTLFIELKSSLKQTK
jgi:nucleotidyltransferase substrate binding protein (TIGR01987 family)